MFGDWPYNTNLLNNANLLIDSVNGDPEVSLVMHVGDIHSGSMACTSASVLPPIAASNSGLEPADFRPVSEIQIAGRLHARRQ